MKGVLIVTELMSSPCFSQGLQCLRTFIHTVRSVRRRLVKVLFRYILRPAASGAISWTVLKFSEEAPTYSA